jgi:hypothetical protein
MRNVRIPTKARWSIFGDTYGGVPSPNTVLVHGYPTRYHGPNFTVPMQGYGYHLRPYARAPFLGFDGLGGVASKIASLLRNRKVAVTSAPVSIPVSRMRKRYPGSSPPSVPENPWPKIWAVWDPAEVWRDYDALAGLCEDDLPPGPGRDCLVQRYELAVRKVRAACAWGWGAPLAQVNLYQTYLSAHDLGVLRELAVRHPTEVDNCYACPSLEKFVLLQRQVRERLPEVPVPPMSPWSPCPPITWPGTSGLGEIGDGIPHRWISALMGGAAGMLAAPSGGSQLAYVGIGALAAGLLGPIGVYGIVAAATASKVMHKPLPALEMGS